MNEQKSLIPLTPGERLMQARRNAGFVRSDVASRLKCAEAVIAALEEGRDSGLAPVYLVGFLKSYARLLDIPRDETQALITEIQQPEPALRTVFPVAAPHQPGDRWLRAASYALASLLVGTLAWQVSHEVVRLTQEERQAVEAGVQVNASIAALEDLVPERSHPGGAEAWQALDQALNPESEPLQAGEYALELRASADSWVVIQDAQGNWLEQDLLRGGSERRYRGFGPFQVVFGRTSALELRIGGQLIDLAPMARDDVTQATLDPAKLLAATNPQ